MRLQAPSPLPRGVVLILACAVAVFLSYFSIRNALAVHYADLETRQGYERATRLEPGDYRNWYLLGRYLQFDLQEADSAGAIQAYLTSLSFNPRSANTWMDLAAIYESNGNLAAARDAYLQAEKDYPTSADVAWRYGNFLLRQGELDPAFLEMYVTFFVTTLWRPITGSARKRFHVACVSNLTSRRSSIRYFRRRAMSTWM